MKQLIVFMILGITVSSVAMSQSKLTDAQRKEFKANMEAYKTELKLTDVQQPKFEEINLQYAIAIAALKDDQGSRLRKLQHFKAASNERNRKMKDLLTAEQYKVFQARQQEVKDNMKSRRKQK